MTLTAMIAAVRQDLHDEDPANYRWTDAVLTRHINHAVARFSQALPLEDVATIATTPSSRDISIAALTTRVMVEAVEYKVGNFPPSYQRFSIWKDILTIYSDAVPDGSNAKVYHGIVHSMGATSTIPVQYDTLVARGAAAFALLEFAAYTTNRVNLGGKDTPRAFRQDAAERLNRFIEELKRLGQQNRVRVRQLYVPYETPVSQSKVMGP